ncbi:MAG: ATP-binding protein [Bryobacteraceae bacterium]
MLNSVRLRLTLWYAGVLALVLVLFAAGVYQVFERAALARLDSELDSAMQVISLSLRHEIEEHKGQWPGEEAFRGVMQSMHEGSFPRQGIAVYQGSRQVARKASYDGLAPPSEFAVKGQRYFTLAGNSRVAAGEVDVPEVAGAYRVVVAERMDSMLAELALLRRTLSVLVPLAVALAALVGYLLARKSLQPVVAMSNAADRIGSSNLAMRIEVANPRDELGGLARTFNRLLDRLQASFERQRQFMADASHELRTPVSIALTAAQVNLSGPDRPASEYREALEMIEKQMARLTRVVNDLFLLARTDSGAPALHRRWFALEETVAESVLAARLLGASKRQDVTCAEMSRSPFDGDEDLIRQLLMLLLDNAIKHTPAASRIYVTLKRDGDQYRIGVADSGTGIPAEAQTSIFERFYRVDKARSRSANWGSGGAGLGLSIGRWIAEAHGGRLELASSGPGGTVFEAILPAPEAITHSEEPPSDRLEANGVPARTPRPVL